MRAACLLLLTFLAFAALAADEEAAQTGTIEVEVVYKGTGEPVEGVYVCVMASLDVPGGNLGITSGYTSASGSFVVRDRPAGSYEVRIRNIWMDEAGHVSVSRFLYDESDAVKTVAVSTGSGARARFVVERGSALSGVVRRRDGSRLDGGVVSIPQRDTGFGEAFSRIDDQGRFEMLGVVLKPTVRATIYSAPRGPDGELAGMPVVAEKEIELAGALTVADLEVETASVEIVLEIERPLWPFGRRPEVTPVTIDAWVGETADPFELGPNILLSFHDGTVKKHARGPVWAGKKTFSFVLHDLPARTQVSLGMEDEDGQITRPLQTVHTGATTPTVTFSIRMPGAQVSRAFWFGVPSVLVLAVFGTILVKQVRKRRAKGAAT